MKITVLSDNNSCGELLNEWGLSFWIETGGKKLLMDTGASDVFHQNAIQLGIRIEEADAVILSHAHHDHGGGLPEFFETNRTAPAYIREGSGENCWHRKEGELGYVGIPQGVLENYSDRIRYVSGVTEIMPGVLIVPHTPSLDMQDPDDPYLLVLEEDGFRPDDFRHEQSLVIETEAGAVIFSSCSHTGPRNITADVRKAIPNAKIRAFIGGLHIYQWTAKQVKNLAEEIAAAGIEKVYTGHCTGEAFEFLKENLGEAAEQFYAGMVIRL